MCNTLHKDSVIIKENGSGWKIFTKYADGLRSISGVSYWSEENGSGWDQRSSGDGFCFFLTRSEARRGIKEWKRTMRAKNTCIRRIEYRQGLGSHVEKYFCADQEYIIALCKEFRVIEC